MSTKNKDKSEDDFRIWLEDNGHEITEETTREEYDKLKNEYKELCLLQNEETNSDENVEKDNSGNKKAEAEVRKKVNKGIITFKRYASMSKYVRNKKLVKFNDVVFQRYLDSTKDGLKPRTEKEWDDEYNKFLGGKN